MLSSGIHADMKVARIKEKKTPNMTRLRVTKEWFFAGLQIYPITI